MNRAMRKMRPMTLAGIWRANMSDFDPNYRPVTYFGPQRLRDHLYAGIKSAEVKETVRNMLSEGRFAEVETLLVEEGFAPERLRFLEALHPRFMGGNYLPDTSADEVEIARIRIYSTTQDVTSVYARLGAGGIRLRVVDEYEGDTLTGESEIHANEPLTLTELADFLLGAWSLIDVLHMNFNDDLERSLGFFFVESDFYPDLDEMCRERVIAAFK